MRRNKKIERGRSGLEEKLMLDLEQRQIPYEYETLKIPYVKETCPCCNTIIKKGIYTPDFIIKDLIIEVKGRFVSTDRTKHLQIKKSNPDIQIRFLFQVDNKIGKKSRYSDWAIKHGYTYAIIQDVKNPQIPEEWINPNETAA